VGVRWGRGGKPILRFRSLLSDRLPSDPFINTRGTQEPIRKIMEGALLMAGKDRAFRRAWEDVIHEGNAFEQMFTGSEVFEDVKVYTDWRPEIMSMYSVIAAYVFGFR
jgi:hypothetical protein